MSYLPESVINKALNEIDITTVISDILRTYDPNRYQTLKQTGKTYKVLCPFHEEKTQSFTIDQKNKLYYCFGCGDGGNIITFVQQYLEKTFPEALIYLKKYSQTLDNYLSPNNNKSYSNNLEEKLKNFLNDETTQLDKNIIIEILGSAQQFLTTQLLKNPRREAQNAREYLNSRGINKEIIEKYGFGYSLPNDVLIQDLIKQKELLEIDSDSEMFNFILRSGIINSYGKNAIQNRITIPVTNLKNQIIAFTGRKINKEKTNNKYINFEDREIYKKGKILQGLGNLHKEEVETKGIYIVEGELDRIAFLEQNHHNVLALGGTNFSIQHKNLIEGLGPKKVIIIPDGDFPGKKTSAEIASLLSKTVKTNIVELPNNEDPFSLFFTKQTAIEEFIEKNQEEPQKFYDKLTKENPELDHLAFYKERPQNDKVGNLEPFYF